MAGALIGALRISLSAETTAFEAGMKRAQKTAQSSAANINKALKENLNVGKVVERSVIGFVTALTLGAAIRAGKAALDYAGHLGELADTLGLTTKDLQEFSYAAGQVGISQEELQVGIQKLTVSMGQAELGAKKQTAAFKAIGLSVDDIKGKDAGEVFRLIAEKLEKVTDRSQRAAIEVALFGKAGAKLDNLLSGSQGRLDELSAAAQKLGVVLSDEQIQRADQTADKLEALQTVLKAQLAGIVADNADSILSLANALGVLAGAIGDSLRGWRILKAEFSEPIDWNVGVIGSMNRGAQRLRLSDFYASGHNLPLGVDSLGRPKPTGGTDLPAFLAPGGGKGKKDHSAEELERKRLDALRKAYDYQRSELDAQKNILEAKKDLSSDYVEQTSLSIQILDLERQQYQAELDNEVAQNEITKGKDGINRAQADHLLALYDQADHDKRSKILDDEQLERQQDVAMLEDHAFERRQEALSKLADLATTQSERRKIELDILKLAYEEKRQALQRIIDNSKNEAEIEDARRDLEQLNANYSADRKGVMNRTAGPLEEWARTVPQTAEQINEALQSIEAQGLDGLSDAIADIISGTRSLKEAFGDVAKSIIADIIRMSIRMLVFRALASAFPGLFGGGVSPGGPASINIGGGTDAYFASRPKFANGGGFTVLGRRGIDNNVMSIGGMPIADVSYGERVSIGKGDTSQRNVTITQNFAFEGVAITQREFLQGLALTKSETIRAIRDNGRRAP